VWAISFTLRPTLLLAHAQTITAFGNRILPPAVILLLIDRKRKFDQQRENVLRRIPILWAYRPAIRHRYSGIRSEQESFLKETRWLSLSFSCGSVLSLGSHKKETIVS